MTYTVLNGQFVIRYPDAPRQGPEPDGDTIKFLPDTPSLVEALPRPLRMAELLPHAFGPDDIEKVTGPSAVPAVPAPLAKWRGRGTVFVHPDLAGGEQVWTGYWERSAGSAQEADAPKGVLEDGPNFPTAGAAVTWGLTRTPRVVVVDAEGGLSWAGEGEPPEGIGAKWEQT